MPFRFEFDAKNKIFLSRFTGQVTDPMVEDFYRVAAPKIMASLDFAGSIVDFSEVTSLELSPQLMRALAWSDPLDKEAARPRVIVAPTPISYGLARIFSSHGEETRPNLHIVRSMAQAYAVLGVINCEFKEI